MQRSPITPEGYTRLVKDLKHHKEVLRPSVIKELEVARAHGDLSENAEYDYAKDKQGMIEARISDLESTVALAEVIDVTRMTPSDRVIFGATIEIYDADNDEEFEYRIVGRLEADAKIGKISFNSPIGKALLGRSTGDEVQVQTPRGVRNLEVLNVRYE